MLIGGLVRENVHWMNPPVLELHADYSREMVHAIFSPHTKFVPQAGTWGLHGIVRVPDRPKDYVFFVTFGQAQGSHQFEESLTEDGVLTWQSQPSQRLDDARIGDFINHREEINNIYLFLRTHRSRDYTYLGRLKYLDNDDTLECPVHFQWQLLQWPIPIEVISRAKISLAPVLPLYSVSSAATAVIVAHTLTPTKIPTGRARGTARSGKPSRARRPDYIADQQANQELGMLGERLVLKMEKKRLEDSNQPALAAEVRHVSVLENDTAGYDILSFETNGSKRFIEVKTTRGSADADFFISANELVFAARNAENYYLYRLYDYLDQTDSAKYFVLKGDMRSNGHLQLVPTTYKVSIRNAAEATNVDTIKTGASRPAETDEITTAEAGSDAARTKRFIGT